MEKNKKTIGSIINQINSLQKMEEGLLEMAKSVNKNDFPNLGFEPVPFLTQVRVEITKVKDTLKSELYNSEVDSDLFKIVY